MTAPTRLGGLRGIRVASREDSIAQGGFAPEDAVVMAIGVLRLRSGPLSRTAAPLRTTALGPLRLADGRRRRSLHELWLKDARYGS
jgi:hypothetical protein